MTFINVRGPRLKQMAPFLGLSFGLRKSGEIELSISKQAGEKCVHPFILSTLDCGCNVTFWLQLLML